MKHNQDTAQPSEFVSELKALVADAEKLMANSLSEESVETLKELRARFEAAQERFAEVYDGAKKKVVAGAKATDETIRANPYQSIAIAAGVGLLIGVLVSRRGK